MARSQAETEQALRTLDDFLLAAVPLLLAAGSDDDFRKWQAAKAAVQVISP